MKIQNDSFSAVSLSTEKVWNHFPLCNEILLYYVLKVSAIPLHCLRMNLTSQSFVMRKKDYSSDDGLHTKRQQLETWKWRLAPKKSCRQKAEGEVITIWVHPAPWKNGFQSVSMVFSLLLCGEEEGKFFIYHAHQVCYCTSHGLKVLFKLHYARTY